MTTVPFNQLALTDANMRKGVVPVADLVASFRARINRGQPPLMQNLSVHEVDRPKKAKGPPQYGVHAGGRRYRALAALVEAGELSADHPVPVRITSVDEAVEESLVENVVRAEPHLADRYEQFRALFVAGVTKEEIALRFDYSPTRVAQLLKLAQVSPEIIQAFREDKISYQQVCAVTVTDDHAEQLDAIKVEGSNHYRNPAQIRDYFNTRCVSGDSPLARFVGAEAYRAAGGAISRYLFSDAAEEVWADRALLERLAKERLDDAAQQLAGEGWAWCEGVVSFPWSESSQYDRCYAKTVPLSEEDARRYGELHDALQALHASNDESDVNADAITDTELEIEDIQARETVWDADDLEFAGVMVTISPYGEACVERGLIKPADKARYCEMLAAKAPPKQPSEAGEQPPAEQKRGGLSGALVENLTAHRTMAMRAAIFDHPQVARAVLLHTLLVQTHYACRYETQRMVTLDVPNDYAAGAVKRIVGEEGGVAQALIDERGAQVAVGLPEEQGGLFAYLLEQSAERLDQLTAYAVSGLIYGVQHNGYAKCDLDLFGQVAAAVDLDPSKTWTVSAANYFGRVSSPLVIEAVAEVDPAEAARLGGLRKAELAAKAEALLAPLGWLPPVMRSAKPPVVVGEGEQGEGLEG